MFFTYLERSVAIFLAVTFAFISSFGFWYSVAEAAALANISDTLTSQKISTVSNHTLVFRTPTGAGDNTDTVTVNFPSGFNMNSLDFNDIDLAHSAGSQSNCNSPTYSNEETLAGTPSVSAWGAALSGQVITLTAPTDGVGAAAIATNACVQLQIGTNATAGSTGDTQITNHSSPASYTIGIAGAFGDVGSTTISILNDDQVSVTANVDQSITFTVSDNSIGFGTLNSGAARYATGDTSGNGSETEAHTLVVGTNASNGYSLTASGTTLTCSSCGNATVSAIGASNTASSAGTEQFGLRMTASGGSGVVSAPYAAAGFAFDTAAFPDEVAAATGSSANTTYSVRYLANIAANTEAGSYTSTITYSATANF
jgi:hypothetical protein